MTDFPQPKKSPLREIPKNIKQEEKNIIIPKGSHKAIAVVQDLPKIHHTITIEENAELLLSLPPQKREVSHQDFLIHVKKDANIEIEQRTTEVRDSLTTIRILLEEENANAFVRARYHGLDDAHHGMMILMHHKAQNTKGDIAIRGVYEQAARAMFSGLIKIDKDAQSTRSYFRDDVLLFDDALAESLPTLEIEANDVKASHGSTTSRMNNDQLFYMQSRGISNKKARNMIIEGFLRFSE